MSEQGKTLTAQLVELDAILAERHPQAFQSLGKPATKDALAALESALGSPLPAEVRALYGWHDGQAIEDPLWGKTWRLISTGEATEFLRHRPHGWEATWVPLFADGGGGYAGLDEDGQLVAWDHEEPDEPVAFEVDTLTDWAKRACASRKKTRTGYAGPFPSWTLKDVRFDDAPQRRSPGDRGWVKALPAGVVLQGVTSMRQMNTCCHSLAKLDKDTWAMCYGFGADAAAARADSGAKLQAWLERSGAAPGIECMKDIATANLLKSLFEEQLADVFLGRRADLQLDLASLDGKRAPLSDPAKLHRVHDLSELLTGARGIKQLAIVDSPLLTSAGLEALKLVPELTTLHLRRCAALESVAPLAALTRLETLTIKDCPALGDEGWRPLAALPSFARLYVERAPITEVALRSLVGTPSLRNVWVGECRVRFSNEVWDAGNWSPRWQHEWLGAM